MKKIKLLLTIGLLLSSLINYSQDNSAIKKIRVTGKIVDKTSNLPLEYATITLINTINSKNTTGSITDAKGEFIVDANEGIYTIKVEFISFKPQEIPQKSLLENTNLGTFYLLEDATQLNEVIIRAEKTTVEFKLDKKIYNVGQDMLVKGGTASDVLDNVPSVSVDAEGNVSLRGNDNVKILIDGRPTNAVNIADALRTIPADALDKVEVITNPSARYDAEGGAGILNIILKKGKNKGTNGTLIGTIGDPKNFGITGNINHKSDDFNIFSTLGYTNSKSPGTSIINSDYLDSNKTILKTINEKSYRERGRKGYNLNFGADWFLTKSLTWTNSVSFRTNKGINPDNVLLYNYETNNNFIRNRYNDQFTKTGDLEYNTNFVKKFKKEGHQLTVAATTSRDTDNDYATITDVVIGNENAATRESTKTLETQTRNLLQLDYVLPLGKDSQFELGYKADFNELLTNYSLGDLDSNGNYTPNLNFTNVLDYKEKINALYTQFGSKYKKFSYLLGIRYEDSNIDINLLTTSNFNNKKYNNFFPSAFLTYQISDESTLSLNYSKRISRPRSRFINPFANYSSNVNLFQGNPDINPAFTNAFDLGYLTKWKKLTVTTSAYFNKTTNVFQFIRRPNGQVVTSVVNGQTVTTPVILTTPINLSNENRFGFEFTLNYSPIKWWKLNSNFNFFQSSISGDYSYIDANTITVNQNFDNKSIGWFTRITSKITLPAKIDWQTNVTYNAPQNNAQGKSLGVLAANLAFSKDVLKEKATISLNVNDVFNSRKRINQTNLATLNSYSEQQWRQRQINLSFTYRFNKKKSDREKPKNENNENQDYQG